jgi:hypothetical protein
MTTRCDGSGGRSTASTERRSLTTCPERLQEHEAARSSPSSAEVKNVCSDTTLVVCRRRDAHRKARTPLCKSYGFVRNVRFNVVR